MKRFLPAQHKNGRVIRLPVAPDPEAPPRPKTRADCIDGPRPCPYIGCRHHLGSDVSRAGGLALYFDEDPSEMKHSCVLDAASRGPLREKTVAKILGISQARVAQLTATALRKMGMDRKTLKQFHDP